MVCKLVALNQTELACYIPAWFTCPSKSWPLIETNAVLLSQTTATVINDQFIITCCMTTVILLCYGFPFLANVNSCSRSLYAVAHPSVCRLSVCYLPVICNVRAPYLAGWNFWQCFYAIWYLGHLFDIHEKFYGDRPRRTPPLEGGGG